MRIAFLCKRRYMSKDVILDRYARLYEIPNQLARLGHQVRGYCLSYRTEAVEGEWTHDAEPGELQWNSRRISRWVVPTLIGYPLHLLRELHDFKPDVVIGASDIPHVIWGCWLSRKLGRPYVVDLYDNFEGFGQARLPGAIRMLRRAVRHADVVLTTSEPLRELVMGEYRATGWVVAMPSTVDTATFRRRDRGDARRELGLPAGARLIGTAGGLYADKGATVLYDAWHCIEMQTDDVHLVLAGPHGPSLPPPSGNRVHYLGAMPHEQVAQLFSALDVGAICVRDTPFGRYCFPQKAYEMLACGLPVVAAELGAMRSLFADSPACLYRVDDAQDLACKLLAQLDAPVASDIAVKDWAQVVAEIEPLIRRISTA